MDTKFPFGAWIYRPLASTTKADVEHWRDCGLTLSMSPDFDPEIDDKQRMLEIMDLCAEAGIRLILCDKRSRWQGAAADPDAYRARFREACADFGHHPAAWGFHVGDEPGEKDIPDVIAAYKIQCEEAPELVPFINFFPFYKPEIFPINEEIFANIPLKLLCYDHYGQLVLSNTLDGWNSYFSNLRLYRNYAEQYHVPLWTTLLSMGHMGYAEPTEADFRWQLSTAVASGCSGILWFHFYTQRLALNYRNGPINKFGERSRTFEDLSFVLREFHLLYGEYFRYLTLKQSVHVGNAYGGFPLFHPGDSEFVLDATDLRGTDAILSFFTDEAGANYLAIVCNSRTEVGNLALTFSRKAGRLIRLGGETEEDVSTSFHDEKFVSDNDSYTYTAWLAPGQITLYRFDS